MKKDGSTKKIIAVSGLSTIGNVNSIHKAKKKKKISKNLAHVLSREDTMKI